MKLRHFFITLLGLAVIGGLTFHAGQSRAQVGLGFSEIIIPDWNPGGIYETSEEIVGQVVLTDYDPSDPSGYVETWNWTTATIPPIFAVVPAGKLTPIDKPALVQVGDVDDGFLPSGCSTPEPPSETPTGETWEVYNANPGRMPERKGTMIREGNVEHWYLSPTYSYPSDGAPTVLLLRRAPASVEESFSRYIRVIWRTEK